MNEFVRLFQRSVRSERIWGSSRSGWPCEKYAERLTDLDNSTWEIAGDRFGRVESYGYSEVRFEVRVWIKSLRQGGARKERSHGLGRVTTMNLEHNFSPKQVAQALQVSESSVKRWCDRGVIRTDRTYGGHRRIPLEHLMEFLESTNRRIVDPSAIGLSDPGKDVSRLDDSRQIARDAIEELSLQAERSGEDPSIANASFLQSQFERALLAGDETQCRKVISSWYAIHGNMASVADDLMAPTFRVIGQMWACGRADVYQERRGCEISIRLIHELRRLILDPGNDAPLAMGGTCEGDNYQVANQLIEMIFREAGWRTISLGSGVPFSSMASAIEKYRPKIFWLSVSHVESEEAFLERFEPFSQGLPQGTMLVVGGRSLSESLRRRMQFSAHCDSMRQLSTLARSLIAH